MTYATIQVRLNVVDVVWKPVVGWESSHEVSSTGQVRTIKGRILSQRIAGGVKGYLAVTLCANGIKKTEYVHHLVILAFTGFPLGEIGTKQGQYTVNHKDTVKTNNHFSNLEWMTASGNVQHAYVNGLMSRVVGEYSNLTKLTEPQVLEIKRQLGQGKSLSAIASQFNVRKGTISAIKNGKTWKHLLQH